MWINYYINQENPDAQKIYCKLIGLEWVEIHLTRFQSTEATVLVFDLPLNVQTPYLKVRREILIGDFFDGNKFKRTRIKLF